MTVPCELRVLFICLDQLFMHPYHMEFCEMLIAATCENWYEICTQGTVISVLVSVKTALTSFIE